MKSIIPTSFLFLLFITTSCGEKNGGNSEPASENDIDAARNFIEAALRGNFKQAGDYMLRDSANEQYLTVSERSYRERLSTEDQNSLRSASINIHNVSQLNDSTTIVIYSNSFRNDHDTLRVIKVNDQWLVDLKYLFEHDDVREQPQTDTLP